MKKSYSFSLTEKSFKKFEIICNEGHFNRSSYLQSMIDTFINSVLIGRFDGMTGENTKFSEKIKECFKNENL